MDGTENTLKNPVLNPKARNMPEIATGECFKRRILYRLRIL
jgi:hypothetical protein